jgi:hypothetical protein
MKIITLAMAAAVALGGLAAAPAIAQPPGHDMMRHDDNDRHDRDMRHNDNDRHDRGRHEGWDRGRHHGWNNHHRRQICRWVWRHHHRDRVCTWR